MTFLDLLRHAAIDPADVALCLHKPADPVARAALLTLVEDAPELFNAYQSTHAARAEATVVARSILASFVMTAPGEHTFVGLYDRTVGQRLTARTALEVPHIREMKDRIDGHIARPEDLVHHFEDRILFRLTQNAALADLARRLVVADPGGRAYMRRGETTPLEVIELKRTASLTPPMPAWDALTLTTVELRAIPRDWALRLSQWRGIYLITDTSDGARYVGAAYGADNLLGRWQAHVAGAAGITAQLRKRDPAAFRFSILELLAPNADPAAVIQQEQRWMDRLHTKVFGLNS